METVQQFFQRLGQRRLGRPVSQRAVLGEVGVHQDAVDDDLEKAPATEAYFEDSP
ncbi:MULTISPECIES: hypothetical protein [Micrococcus]|uniref:hypothetical protein n=1 Tax=Micrococcus antarcticus TaxID=86171 RepID=UPI00384B2C2F